jgi:16S rRNA G527 N7-methylase RsmG
MTSALAIGSGAGLPGSPRAIWKPDGGVTLDESSHRKAVFLRESSRHLGNVSVRGERMEDTSERGDWVVTRAVDPKEVIDTVPNLAPKIGLMLGEEDFSLIQAESRIAWAEPLRLPWGDRRLCVYGICST